MLVPDRIGGIEFFRASEAHEDRVYKRIKNAVFGEFLPGEYSNKEDIVRIVNKIFLFYYEILDEFLPKIEPKSFVGFLVREYERYGRISDAHKRGELSDEEDVFWMSYALGARRGIKHLLELLCISDMQSEKISRDPQEQWDAINMVFIVAEELVNMYMRSDFYTHLLDEVTLKLNPEEYVYFNVLQDGGIVFDPREGVRDESKYIPNPDFLQDTETQSRLLEKGFRERLGVTFSEALGAIKWIIENYSESGNPESPGFFRRQEVVEVFKSNFHITSDQADLLIRGFSLTAQCMKEEGRELFRPKQEYRAYKRAFFTDASSGDDLLFFSRRMAEECCTLIVRDLAFKKLPPEWRSKKINDDLAQISAKAGRWFESVVESNLNKIGFIGVTSLKALHFKSKNRIMIPRDVGEIDFLGFCPKEKMLIVVEAKQVGVATEPRMYLDDYSKFLSDKGSYGEKFERKYKWVQENAADVEVYLQDKFDCAVKAESIGYVMITRYPSFVSLKISEFTCISLPEFMQKYATSGGQWTFSKVSINA